jgi:hypothetical protein
VDALHLVGFHNLSTLEELLQCIILLTGPTVISPYNIAEIPLFSSQIYSVDTHNPVSDFGTVTAQNYLQLNLGSSLLSLALPLLMLCLGLPMLCSGLIMLCSGLLRPARACSAKVMNKIVLPQATHAPLYCPF